MARIIGDCPDNIGIGLRIMYDFIRGKLPDYICASFLPQIKSEKSKNIIECDMLLFVPHMGVYVLDVKGVVGFAMQDNIYHYIYQDGMKMICDVSKRQKRLRTQRESVKEYLKEKFNMTPLVYELECFPALTMSGIDKRLLPPDFDPNHVITKDDLKSRMMFLHKIIGCSIFMQSHLRDGFFEDLSDKDAHDLFYFWETGVYGAKRPDRPPFVFMSYNQHNAEISLDIQTALEDRGVYVWRAPKDVPIGKHYLPEEMKAIEECDVFLILLSISAQNSPEVKKEFDEALRINKPILPIWVENVSDKEIDSYYREKLVKYQYRMMSKLNEEIVEEIVAMVKQIKMNNDSKLEV